MDSRGKEILDSVKKDVRSVLITESGGLLLEDFMKIFKQLTNSSIPYRRLGYQSVEELLLEATDVCRCQRLPSGQLHLRPVCDQSTSHVRKMVERSRKPRTPVSRRVAMACRQLGQHVPRLPDVRPEVQSAPVRGTVPVEVRQSLLDLLAAHPQGIHLDEINLKHKTMFGHAITFIALGFFSMKGMLESIPHLVRLKETPTGDKAFPMPAPGCDRGSRQDAGGTGAESRPASSVFLSYEDSVRGLNEKLELVISAQQTAPKVSDVLNLYLRQFGHSLDYQEYGFTSLLGALASLGPPFLLEKRDDDWHVSVKRSGGGRPAANRAIRTPQATSDTQPDGCRAAEQDGPPPLAGLPARFAVQQLSRLEQGPQETTETGYPLLEVVITHVRSPGEFFFCLASSACELERLESELAAVYGGVASRRPPPDCHLTVGRPLAVRSPHGWRRALLLGRVAEHVKVYLVDTGASLLLPLESVRDLQPQFVEPPALAHEGTLARVAPRHDIWTRPALRLFDSLVGGNVPLVATVLRQSQFCSTMLLCDTRGETDVHVGDRLVSANHAVVRQEDWPPAALFTPRSRLLQDVYQLLGGPPRRQPGSDPPAEAASQSEYEAVSECESESSQAASLQDRMPPEGAEPLCPASRPQQETGLEKVSSVAEQVAALKVQCYDTQKQYRTVPAGPRRAALQAKLRRLEAQLDRLEQ